MFFSSHNDDSYDAAIAHAMGTHPRVVDERKSDPPVSRPATAPNVATIRVVEEADRRGATSLVSSQSDDVQPTRTFVNSTDVMAQRRVVKSSPTPPVRQAQRPVRQVSSIRPVEGTSGDAAGGHGHPAATSPPLSDSISSDLSTVSETGTALSAGGAPYKVSAVAVLTVAPRLVPEESLHKPWNKQSIGRRPAEATSADASTPVPSTKPHIDVIRRWVQYLKWRAKWRSPFATTVRGQILEAMGMLRDPSFDAIPSASLRTQIQVWQGQLSQFLLSAQSSAKLHVLFQKHDRSPQKPEHARDTASPPKDSHEQQNAAPPPRKTPLKILRRGDGLRRAGIDRVSAPQQHNFPSSTDVAVAHDVQHAPKVPDPIHSPSLPSEWPTSGKRNAAAAASAHSPVHVSLPVASASGRARAKELAAFLEQVGGVPTSAQTKPMSVPAVRVATEVLDQRRNQLLNTLFQSPDLASPDMIGSNALSSVPRFDIRHHRDVFCLDGDASTTNRSVFIPFQGRPRQLQELIAATMTR